jgi:RNA polymerase sigma-70 factor (ECF subfamily)
LASEESIAKLISRAKQKLRQHKVSLEIPPLPEITVRLESVLKVLYLMFNEGYAASGGDELIRKDLCFEAIRLCESLSRHPVTDLPEVHALAALFLSQAARLSTRCDSAGELLLLSEQDRSLWDRKMMNRSLRHFRLSASGKTLSDYHLEAEIAVCHTFAINYESTDWCNILECYEALQKRRFSPVVELNRIVALAEIEGAKLGLSELEKLRLGYDLSDYYLLHATEAHFLSEIGAHEKALSSYTLALHLAENNSVKRFLKRKMESLRVNYH